jgi:CBS domain-containing protein
MIAEQIMKRTPKCLTANDTAEQAARLMRDENIGFVPVCADGGEVIGIVTDRDIVVRLAADKASLATHLATIMSPYPVVCSAKDDLSRVEAMMEKERKSRVVCVDDGGRAIGIISLSDLAQHEDRERVGALLCSITRREVHGSERADVPAPPGA